MFTCKAWTWPTSVCKVTPDTTDSGRQLSFTLFYCSKMAEDMKHKRSVYINIHERNLDPLIEQIRVACSHMLKMYLLLYKSYEQLNTDIKEEKLKRRFYSPVFSYYDENGKINWDIISQFMPPDIEKYIHNNYSMLNNNEIRLCCLLFFNVSAKTIANILPYKQTSIRSILYKVKQKTGLKDIKEILEKIIVNQAWTNQKIKLLYINKIRILLKKNINNTSTAAKFWNQVYFFHLSLSPERIIKKRWKARDDK